MDIERRESILAADTGIDYTSLLQAAEKLSTRHSVGQLVPRIATQSQSDRDSGSRHDRSQQVLERCPDQTPRLSDVFTLVEFSCCAI